MGVRAAYSRERFEKDEAERARREIEKKHLHDLWRMFCQNLAEHPVRTLIDLAQLLFRRLVIPLCIFAAGYLIGRYL